MDLINTPRIPKVSHRFVSLDSTNAEAIRQLSAGAGAVAGAVYRTEEQSAGRGQGNNSWHATAGANLTLSVVLTPDHLSVTDIFALVQLTGLAVAATARCFLPAALGEEVRVKWPNDVYVRDRKLAGVLVQNGLRGRRVGWSVLGVGLNVNENDFPPALQPSAVSLTQLTGQPLDTDAVADELYRQLTRLYPMTARPNLPRLNAAYHQQLYRKDIPSNFALTANGQAFSGIIRGVNAAGQLRIEQPVGRESAFAVGEVRLVN